MKRGASHGTGDGGAFGTWARDDGGLVCFELDIVGLDRRNSVLPYGDPRLVWHLVGNDRLTATAHAGGWTTLYVAEHGLVRLNGTDPSIKRELGGTWSVTDASGRELLSPFSPEPLSRARWGTGYAEWSATGRGVEVRRRVRAPFGDIPALLMDVEVRAATAERLRGGEYIERWGFAPYPVVLGALMSRRLRAPRDYTPEEKLVWFGLYSVSSLSRTLVEALRRRLGARMTLEGSVDLARSALVLTPAVAAASKGGPPKPSMISRLEGVVFLAALGTGEATPEIEQKHTLTRASVRVPLTEGKRSESFTFAVGACPAGELDGLLERLRTIGPGTDESSWRAVAGAELPGSKAVSREVSWHAAYLRGSQVRDEHFECRYVPQGSAYGFIQGGQGAPRDYAISTVPLTYFDPAGARDMLRLMMRLTRPDGAMMYAHTGSGACTSAIMHSNPTDLPLFFLWALVDYVWATGDEAFLEEVVPFCRRSTGSTVRERVLLAWKRTRDGVGRGPHGMLRAGSGDWMDPISLMVPDPVAFHRKGESAFNTALAAYALPRAADLVSRTHRHDAEAMRAYSREMVRAMDAAWQGDWYLRGWDGRGGALGAEHLFLDAQAWCLIARIGEEERRASLVRAIDELCDLPSPIGATILDHPHPVRLSVLPPGWDCNGGVWAAINGLLSWAYALHDPELAWRSIEKQSLAAHARAYPNVWFGVWSGPDAYNAHYAERPGETFTHPATPMQEYPVMNSNAHAGPLLALLKVLGVEATPEGIIVEPRLRKGAGPWRLSTALVDVESDGSRVEVRPAAR